jgi:hypothetical protein
MLLCRLAVQVGATAATSKFALRTPNFDSPLRLTLPRPVALNVKSL